MWFLLSYLYTLYFHSVLHTVDVLISICHKWPNRLGPGQNPWHFSWDQLCFQLVCKFFLLLHLNLFCKMFVHYRGRTKVKNYYTGNGECFFSLSEDYLVSIIYSVKCIKSSVLFMCYCNVSCYQRYHIIVLTKKLHCYAAVWD